MRDQIEKMADILCEAKEHDCKGGNDCLCVKQAEALYNAGYRRQSEVEKLQIEIEALKIANEKMYAANQEQQAQIEHLTAEIDGKNRFIRDLMKD